jgi:hypothetical protein
MGDSLVSLTKDPFGGKIWSNLSPNIKIWSALPRDGATILFWHDLWDGHLFQQEFPQLFPFTKNPNIIVRHMLNSAQLSNNFHLPLSEAAHNQFILLQTILSDLHLSDEPDTWTYVWGNPSFSAARAYNSQISERNVHPVFHWTWSSKC